MNKKRLNESSEGLINTTKRDLQIIVTQRSPSTFGLGSGDSNLADWVNKYLTEYCPSKDSLYCGELTTLNALNLLLLTEPQKVFTQKLFIRTFHKLSYQISQSGVD